MSLDTINERGMVILGCGKMGSAMLEGWLDQGLMPSAITVSDPAPSDWLQAQDVRLNTPFPSAPAVLLIAVKPQMMGEALPAVARLGDQETLVISVAAGTTIERLGQVFGPKTPIIRAMPNTPAAIGRGITALIGNPASSEDDMRLAEVLLRAVGQTVRLENETQMDAVTGVSGSGPAYVFHLIEALAAAGQTQGLPPELAMQLAKATVAGAGALAESADQSPAELRRNVTSPAGTTQAALEVLMDNNNGFPPLLTRAVAAAAQRSKELAHD